MASDITDRLADDAERHAEHIRQLLSDRIEQLRRKLDDARDRVDVPGVIRRHPWASLGVAFALGAAAARGARRRARRPSPSNGVPRSFTRTALATLGALGLSVVRELAVAQLGRSARRWWIEHGGSPDELDVTPRDEPGPFARR